MIKDCVIILISILTALLFSLFPFKIKKVRFDMVSGSFLAILLLVIFKVVNPQIFTNSLLGNGYLHPWKILIIFFSVAYVCISTDLTGIFEFIAYEIVKKSQNNGRKLFLFFYLFAGFLAIFTSNDIVILTLTPIIIYLGKYAKINVIPYLFAEFFAANIFAMALYTGSPTNIIIGDALQFSFFSYFKIFFFPTLIAVSSNYLLLYLMFKKQIPKTFKTEMYKKYILSRDGMLSIVLLIIMVIILSLSQFLKLDIWLITLFFTLIYFLKDLIFRECGDDLEIAGAFNKKYLNKIGPLQTIKRMPWEILPFLLCFFLIVGAANELGIIAYLSNSLSLLANSIFSAIFSIGIISAIVANIIIDIPTSILFSYSILSPIFSHSLKIIEASAYAVVAASNIGPNITLIGSLAGIMWLNILKRKGIKMNHWEFFKKGIIISPLVLTLTLFTLYIVNLLY